MDIMYITGNYIRYITNTLKSYLTDNKVSFYEGFVNV